MRHSDLLVKILKIAEEIRKEYGLEHISASIIIGACSAFQEQRYTGQNTIFYPERYEEERLRYAYTAIYKLRVSRRSYFGRLVKNDPKRFDKPFDFGEAITVAQTRGRAALSADLVFLSAVASMEPEDRACLPAYRCPLNVSELMTALDQKIYDYVITENQKLVEELTKNIEEATTLRDWKPARKFKEPEELSKEFFSKIKATYSDKMLTIRIPQFFGSSSLILTVYSVDGIYYVHDNGCAIQCLKKRVKDQEKLHRILKKVCSQQWMENGCIQGSFTSYHQFFRFLQKLMFVAHGELVYTRLYRQVYAGEKGGETANKSCAEDFDYKKLLYILKNQISFNYNENLGLYMHIGTTYSLNSTTISYLMETVSDREIRFSDRRKGKLEGEILESLYYVADDLTPYGRQIDFVAKPFGGNFSAGNVSMTAKQKDWYASLLRFINMAVLLSEFGRLIKVKEK